MPYREKEKNTEFYLQKRTKHIEENSASLKMALFNSCLCWGEGWGWVQEFWWVVLS